MLIKTSRFGEIEYDEQHIFNLVEGPVGFPDYTRFMVLTPPDNGVFKWFQSLDDPELAFVIVEPFQFFPEYEFELEDNDVNLLQVNDPKKLLIYTIVVIPEEIKKMTANLKAPIVINGDNRKGKQVVLLDDRYGTRHYILDQ